MTRIVTACFKRREAVEAGCLCAPLWRISIGAIIRDTLLRIRVTCSKSKRWMKIIQVRVRVCYGAPLTLPIMATSLSSVPITPPSERRAMSCGMPSGSLSLISFAKARICLEPRVSALLLWSRNYFHHTYTCTLSRLDIRRIYPVEANPQTTTLVIWQNSNGTGSATFDESQQCLKSHSRLVKYRSHLIKRSEKRVLTIIPNQDSHMSDLFFVN